MPRNPERLLSAEPALLQKKSIRDRLRLKQSTNAEIQTERSIVPWQKVEQDMPFWRKKVAQEAFAATLIQTFYTQATEAIPAPVEPPIMAPRDMREQKNYQRAVSRYVLDLYADYQDTTRTRLNEHRDKIYQHVAGLPDEEFIDFQARTGKAAKTQHKKLPDAAAVILEDIINPLPSWQEIEMDFSHDKKTIAKMVFSTQLMRVFVKDIKQHTPKDGLHKRDKEVVQNDLNGLMQAYQAIQEEEGLPTMPKDGEEAGYYERVQSMMPKLEAQRDDAYRVVARLPDEAVTEYAEQSRQDLQSYMKRKLHSKGQREVLADFTGEDAESVLEGYGKAARNTILHWAGNEVVAGMGGLALEHYLLKGINPDANALEVALSYGMLVGGIIRSGNALGSLMEKTGGTVSVWAKGLNEHISAHTSNKLLRRSGVIAAYGVKDIIDEPMWAALYSALYATHMLSPKDTLNYIISTNIAAFLYEVGTTRATKMKEKHKMKTREQARKAGELFNANKT